MLRPLEGESKGCMDAPALWARNGFGAFGRGSDRTDSRPGDSNLSGHLGRGFGRLPAQFR